MNVVRFQSRGAEKYRFLSNFWLSPFVVDGKTYATNEHFYQASKATCDDDHELVRNQPGPKDAMIAGRYKIRCREDWERPVTLAAPYTLKEMKMGRGLVAKFSQNRELREALLATGDDELVEHSRNDSYWGDPGDGSGSNVLGKMLMRLRELFRRHLKCSGGS